MLKPFKFIASMVTDGYNGYDHVETVSGNVMAANHSSAKKKAETIAKKSYSGWDLKNISVVTE